ncbi:hypothetical protein YT1_p20010 (plasmid) [Rhodococcus ruber]|nr:hypothetical protein YT1_p20010 [Rhodococcus ruber]
MALKPNNGGSDGVQRVKPPLAPRPDMTGPQKSEYSVYDHASPSDPLLWLPDIHAWAWGRGGQMRAKIAHRIEVSRL